MRKSAALPTMWAMTLAVRAVPANTNRLLAVLDSGALKECAIWAS